ncbi:MAG TPA: MFS transporter [Tepidiformaceae bacterium]|nr:MFS transporter [Tepidiformaceae bacterium]
MARGALAHRDFRLLLIGSGVVSFVAPMQFITQIFWIQDTYPHRDVFFVGLLGASRGGAMLLFSLIGGAFADRFERRKVLLVCECTALSINALIALLMLTNPLGDATIGLLLVLTFVAASNMAIDIPTRTASTPAVVGMEDLASAITLQMVAQQLTSPLALPLVGFLNSQMSGGTVYSLTLLAWVLIIPMIAALRFRSVGSADRREGMVGNIRSGLAYARSDATIFGVVAAVFAIQCIGMPGPATLGPVWMRDVMELSKAQFGFMAMTWGLGTFVASFFFAFRRAFATRGLTLCLTTVGFAVCAIVFAHSRYVPVTAVVNFGLGFCVVGTMVTASTIVQQAVKDEMRGRVLGLFPLMMGGSMLMAAPVSAFGQAFGLPLTFALLAWLTLAATGSVVVRQPSLRRAGTGGLVAAPVPAAAGE